MGFVVVVAWVLSLALVAILVLGALVIPDGFVGEPWGARDRLQLSLIAAILATALVGLWVRR